MQHISFRSLFAYSRYSSAFSPFPSTVHYVAASTTQYVWLLQCFARIWFLSSETNDNIGNVVLMYSVKVMYAINVRRPGFIDLASEVQAVGIRLHSTR